MALYDDVRVIAPEVGGHSAALRRLQIYPDSAPEPVAEPAFEFDAAGADAIVLTNRLPMAVDVATADGRPALLRHDDGGSLVYACDGCAVRDAVYWRIVLHGIAENLDLIVLPGSPATAAR